MPESMTSAEWIVAGWGFASGISVALVFLLPYIWRLQAQITSRRPSVARRLLRHAGAGYRAAWRALADLSDRVQPVFAEVALPAAVVPDGWFSTLPAPYAPFDFGVPSSSGWNRPYVSERRTVLLDGESEPVPVPDGDRPVEGREDDYPYGLRGGADQAVWRRGPLTDASASTVRYAARKAGAHRAPQQLLEADTARLPVERLNAVLADGAS